MAKAKKTITDPDSYQNFLTVGQLLEFIKNNNVSMDARVMIQRVEDVYFEENNWATCKKEGFGFYRLKRINDKIDSGEFSDKKNYPGIEDPEKLRISDADLENSLEEYVPVWTPALYPNDKHLFLDAHY